MEKNRVRLFDYESMRKEMSFKVLELSCEALGTFDFPFPSFHANPYPLAPLQPCESPFDPISCELISGKMVIEQAYGDVALGYALRANTLP